jgi:hypothetical protein
LATNSRRPSIAPSRSTSACRPVPGAEAVSTPELNRRSCRG